MKRNKTIVLEGVPASGKTSLADYLCDVYGYFKVNESTGKLSTNTGNQLAIFHDTIKKYSLACNKPGFSIIDRGYPSLLAWDYCCESGGFTQDYRKKFNWIKEALKKGDLYEPTVYVYLRITPELSFQRRSRKPNRADIWCSEIGVINCIKFYDKFFKRQRYYKRTIVVDGNLSTKLIAEIIIKRIKSDAPCSYNLCG